MSEHPTSTTSSQPVRTPGAGSWLRWTVAAFFGLFYAFAIWLAVVILITTGTNGSGLSGKGVLVLLLPVVFPILVYAGIVVLGRRLHIWQQACVFVGGLALVGVFWMNVVMLQIAAQTTIIGG